MRRYMTVLAGTMVLAAAMPAYAKKWVDYAPQKGYWEIRYIKVDPNKIDQYLTSMRTSWIPGEELLKKQGVIYGYQVMVSLRPLDEKANIIICIHYTRFANLDPNEARDAQLDKKMDELLPKAASDKMAAEFNTYRKFVGEEIYIPVGFPQG